MPVGRQRQKIERKIWFPDIKHKRLMKGFMLSDSVWFLDVCFAAVESFSSTGRHIVTLKNMKCDCDSNVFNDPRHIIGSIKCPHVYAVLIALQRMYHKELLDQSQQMLRFV